MSWNLSITSAASIVLLVACSKAPEITTFVPGQRMIFPINSAGVLDDLGRLYMINCKSSDPAIEQSCAARMSERIQSCQGSEPPILESKEHYRVIARTFAQCIMPIPLCNGREVASMAACKTVASEA